jgi:hypothetical protein
MFVLVVSQRTARADGPEWSIIDGLWTSEDAAVLYVQKTDLNPNGVVKSATRVRKYDASARLLGVAHKGALTAQDVQRLGLRALTRLGKCPGRVVVTPKRPVLESEAAAQRRTISLYAIDDSGHRTLVLATRLPGYLESYPEDHEKFSGSFFTFTCFEWSPKKVLFVYWSDKTGKEADAAHYESSFGLLPDTPN